MVRNIKQPKQANMSARPSTQVKVKAIAAARRWTQAETLEIVVDEFIARNNIQLPAQENQPQQIAS